MANGMAGLYIGVSGLNAAQAALNTTAHNLANINVPGYTRQQIGYSASKYYTLGTRATGIISYGVGVEVSQIRRVRDELIDKAYRQENGRLQYYGSQFDALGEVESLFGEMQGVTFQSTITNLWSSLNELSKNPSSTVSRSALIQSATAFIDRANSIHLSLTTYQKTLNTQVNNIVNRVNELGNTINSLNSSICAIEGTRENANDLRDQRDSALDELSGYIKIQYEEKANGVVVVNAEGVPFVADGMVYSMSTQEIDGTSLLKPVWPFLGGRDVFPAAETISAINNNDIGQLKGLLLARGNRAVDYKSVPVEPTEPDISQYDMTDPVQAAEYQSAKDQYDLDYIQYEKDCKYYNEYIGPSVISSTMAGLDKLVNGIVTAINDILCPETTKSFTAADGTVYTDVTVLDTANTGYGNDEDKSIGVELFARSYTERYIQVTADDGTVYYVKNNKNIVGNDSDYTLGNLVLNPVVSNDKATIPLATSTGAEDFKRAQQLVDAWKVKFASLNPSTYAKQDFQSFYNNLVSEFADVGKILGRMVANQEIQASGYDNQRLETEGVSSDEELQNMIKFHQAYNAASRYVTTVSDMLEHLIMRLGA